MISVHTQFISVQADCMKECTSMYQYVPKYLESTSTYFGCTSISKYIENILDMLPYTTYPDLSCHILLPYTMLVVYGGIYRYIPPYTTVPDTGDMAQTRYIPSNTVNYHVRYGRSLYLMVCTVFEPYAASSQQTQDR